MTASDDRFPSVAAIREGHAALIAALSDPDRPAVPAGALAQFIAKVRGSGVELATRFERNEAQSVINYWANALYTAPGPATPPLTAADTVLAPFDPSKAPDLSDKPSPFKGLAAFGPGDAGRFFGRAEASQALAKKVVQQPLVLVSGPSGSGKSSLVLAGLLPALVEAPAPGGKEWRILPVLIPGSDPLAALVALLQSLAVTSEVTPSSLGAAPELFRTLIERGGGGRPALLVVDQFEEVFTLCENQADRERFAAAVAALALESDRRPAERLGHRVVLTVREDYLGQTLQLAALCKFRDGLPSGVPHGSPSLGPLANDPEAQFTVTAMSSRELREVIERPAELLGLKFDDGIAEELVKEVAGEPTALPLLQFALTKLWERRLRNRITWEEYREVGSPREALKRTADELYRQLPQDLDREVSQRIFLDLMQPAVGVEVVRRRARRELLRRHAVATTVDEVLRRWVAAGLLRETKGTEPNDDRFEVAHEALTRNWPLLAGWLEEKRKTSEKELQLEATARLWRESGRQDGYLLAGTALEEAKRYAGASAEIAELVRVSQAKQERWQRTLRWTLTAAIVVLVVACGLLWRESSRAKASLRLAEENRQLAEVRRMQAEFGLQSAFRTLSSLHQLNERLRAKYPAAKSKFLPTQGRVRPIQPGVSIGGPVVGNAPGASRGGVLTAIVRDRRKGKEQGSTRIYLLTIPQALTTGRLEVGLKVYQPAPAAGMKPEEKDLVGRVSRWVAGEAGRAREATGVIAELAGGVQADPAVYAFGPIRRTGQVEQGAYVQMVGTCAILGLGRVVARGVDVQVQYAGPGGTQLVPFRQLIAIQAITDPKAGGNTSFAHPGESGAPVLTLTGELVGVVLAEDRGNDGRLITYAVPIGPVLEALDVELVPPQSFPKGE